ncbi:aminotransferase class IV [Spirillospora sp. CA-294931]|uniref:aminotransferase class IV n=1 Tax=Spirillospora sp. CA-294931 TaxID=3240042 RepID=UPI003D93E41C
MNSVQRIEVNGQTPRVDDLPFPALLNYGHFTTMQIRNGAVRGLDLHLTRLDTSTRELFDTDLDRERVRDHIRHALADVQDASVRTVVFRPDDDSDPSILVAVSPPADAPRTPQRLMSVQHQRGMAHIKHLGAFAQIHYRRQAQRAGFDEALFTTESGNVSEGSITNIGFFDGPTLVWPDAPALPGITLLAINQALAAQGLTSERRTVHLDDVPTFDTVFLTNSQGISPVAQLNTHPCPLDPTLITKVTALYESTPWTKI